MQKVVGSSPTSASGKFLEVSQLGTVDAVNRMLATRLAERA